MGLSWLLKPKALSGYGDSPFSGYDDFEYVKNALSLRAVNYIPKPVSPEEFDKSLNEIVKRLDSQKIEFTQSEEYIETRFRGSDAFRGDDF